MCSQNEIVYADCQGAKYKGNTSLASLFVSFLAETSGRLVIASIYFFSLNKVIDGRSQYSSLMH